MSLYVYECRVCLTGSEKIQRETEKPAPRCELCGAKMRLNLIATEVAEKENTEEAK
jgi:predicted nucleic acid-binding Zn ribbon protein